MKQKLDSKKIRNVAIIAHVDHGKTTLVDGLLKQAKVFAEYEAEMTQETILDSNDLERERGLTILSKNTAVYWNNHKINILDTPGHADFAGEVERVLSMVDGCVLLVDAAEGVLSQTKYVLSLAFKQGLKVIVLINKVDKKDQRAFEVLSQIETLFLELAIRDDQIDFPVIYAVGREGIAGLETKENPDNSLTIADSKNLAPLFEKIIDFVPHPKGEADGGFQMQITTLDSDLHKGIYAIGRVQRGVLKQNQPIVLMRNGKVVDTKRAEYIFTFNGLKKELIEETSVGDIVAIAGFSDVKIGDTVVSPDALDALPDLDIAEPTIQIDFLVSNSPFVGRDGKFVTSQQIKTRLEKELRTNVGLRLNASGGDSFTVSGRGELHLTILIEIMRREGYEFSVSRPQVIYKTIDGVLCEPWELATIEVPEEYSGVIITEMAARKAEMVDMKNSRNGIEFTYKVSTRHWIGARSELLQKTSGMSVVHTQFIGYEKKSADALNKRSGAVITTHGGQAIAYGLEKIQKRADTFVGPGEEVYVGMIVGLNSRYEDLNMNVTRGKKLTNMRASSSDDITKLAPPVKMSLEQCLIFLKQDELLEVTPKNLRLRKRSLVVKQ
ncbi:translational GTPase TypA [Candidatus Roizmanbacteria bacterium CG22_combo_CG10-13_8_21_14_all_38_20]|uniref:50S ribosomal subunit assembly factor BipA n=1 Tax=Candidatus Roizmanbacteria bacterium CG22_combo_CG10-13_8_21_14_all_38_20 TaxID=1974862 RepID=A0A2H0BWM4_9BACT|nr:translational GTPase TypA [Candidatus Microgenomates bacterium]PIP62072.1 MAG: translational GTPase TypA [Candidatus Roizmanbacteria bacterium CG22_combo_CG10-13_8_21_14_all_38_20]PJC31312.1 MAG: translational GTPase TypA [Candidatus Roizmanbacteria bacterium CG_4_9_14_0_2_um_filter_38_17]